MNPTDIEIIDWLGKPCTSIETRICYGEILLDVYHNSSLLFRGRGQTFRAAAIAAMKMEKENKYFGD